MYIKPYQWVFVQLNATITHIWNKRFSRFWKTVYYEKVSYLHNAVITNQWLNQATHTCISVPKCRFHSNAIKWKHVNFKLHSLLNLFSFPDSSYLWWTKKLHGLENCEWLIIIYCTESKCTTIRVYLYSLTLLTISTFMNVRNFKLCWIWR